MVLSVDMPGDRPGAEVPHRAAEGNKEVPDHPRRPEAPQGGPPRLQGRWPRLPDPPGPRADPGIYHNIWSSWQKESQLNQVNCANLLSMF